MSQFPLAPLSPFSAAMTFPAGIGNLAPAAVVLSTTAIDNSDSLLTRWREITVSVALTSYTPVAPAWSRVPWCRRRTAPTMPRIASAFPLGAESVPTSWCSIDADTGTKLAYLVFRSLQPVKYRLLLRNSTGANWPAAGTVVTWAGTVIETR